MLGFLCKPTEIILESFYVDQNRQVVEMINPRVFTHSFSYLNQTLAEKTERFATIFDCEITNPLAIKITTRATLRTVFALSVNPLVQNIARQQNNLCLAIVVQALFFSFFLHVTRYFATQREKKLEEMSAWLRESRVF
jgi:hypothetical protein